MSSSAYFLEKTTKKTTEEDEEEFEEEHNNNNGSRFYNDSRTEARETSSSLDVILRKRGGFPLRERFVGRGDDDEGEKRRQQWFGPATSGRRYFSSWTTTLTRWQKILENPSNRFWLSLLADNFL